MKTRGVVIGTAESVQLKAQFSDPLGNPGDLNSFPRVQIIQPNSAIYQEYTSIGVYKIDTGLYGFDFAVPINGPVGVWTDVWQGTLGEENYIIRGSFNFIVSNTNLAAPNIDGYFHLGDKPRINLSQEAIQNINHLMELLRLRLQSSGRHQTKDSYGNIVYENCDIFSVDELYAFLCSSLAEFNLTPHFTFFKWEEPVVVDMFADIIVEGAYIMALASKALIEKGREFNVTDNGISFQPPAVADLLNSQMGTLLGPYRDRLKSIKYQMKPNPLGLGTLRITAVAPQMLRLRHRRARQMI